MNLPHHPVRLAPQEAIVRLRGQAVILDTNLAELYGVPVKRLNQQVTRNRERFPDHFCFQLTDTEWQALRLQNATSKNRGGRRYPPYAFTEHGAIMAATVLNSPQAIQMSITIVTAFVKLRRMALSVESLARKVAALENKYDASFSAVFDAIRNLMEPSTPPRERIGFQ
ncbi:MAG: ORF6N domain-containing protein [bacterium]